MVRIMNLDLEKKPTINITFKLLTHGDERKIEKELKGLKKIHKNSNPELTTRLKYIITSVNGDSESKTIRNFVDNGLLALDSRALRNHYQDVTPDIDMTFYVEEEEASIPLGVSFFWPDVKL